MQTTLVILKPDAVQRGLMGQIISRFENKGLRVVGAKLMNISQDLAERHYAVHQGKPFYPGLIRFMTSSPVLVLAVHGAQAVDVVRKLMGSTAGFKAEPGTIRGDFGNSAGYNLVHGSDAPETAEQELKLFFKDDELLSYERAIEKWVNE
jgi:nucleoside-diphosphate kinase